MNVSTSATWTLSRGRRRLAQTPRFYGRSALSLAETLYYCLILTLPFEELFTILGFSVAKLVGLLFFLVSITEWRAFYGTVPGPLVASMAFTSIGFIVDLVSYAQVDLLALNQFSRPVLAWWLMLAAYNLALNAGFDRMVRIVYFSSLVFACFESLSIGGTSVRVYEGSIGGEEGSRIAVLGSDPNFASMYLSLGVLFGLVRGLNMVKTSRFYRALFLIGAGIGFYAILKTGSRGGLLALCGSVLSLGLTVKPWKKTVTSFAAVSCVLLVMGVAISRSPYLAARFRDSAETRNTSGRLEIWQRAIRLSGESPLYGFGNSMHLFKLGEKTGNRQRGTHNLFLSALLASGVVGLGLFMFFYARTFHSVWCCRTYGLGKVLFSWFVLGFIAALSLNMEREKWLWIMFGLALAAENAYSKKRVQIGRQLGSERAGLMFTHTGQRSSSLPQQTPRAY